MDPDVKTAVVHDALPFYGGAERTLAALLEVLPGAPVFTVIHHAAAFRGTPLESADIRPTRIDALPGVHKNHYRYFPLFPSAIRRLDLGGYDLIVASSYALAHWAPVAPYQRLLVYCYTPMRYLWSQRESFLSGLPAIVRPAARLYIERMRRQDRLAARRAGRTVAISHWVAHQVREAYGLEADVIYPPVETSRFELNFERDDFFLCLTRLARHKKVEIVVEAFNRLGLPLVIAGDGPEKGKLAQLAGRNIRFVGQVSDTEVANLAGRARALVHMAAEDFGIAVVEAQAAGCPVIAFRGGSNLETIVEGKTGIFADQQDPDGLVQALQQFIVLEEHFDSQEIRRHAGRFSKQRFQEEFKSALAGTPAQRPMR